jgi:Protein kinase domain
MDIEKIIDDLISGALSTDAASQLVANAIRQDPQGTRFWSQRIDSALGRGRLGAVVARALLDAMEDCRADRTVWLDPGFVVPQLKTADASATGTHAHVEPSSAVGDLERLRAALFDPMTKRAAAPSEGRTAAPAQPANETAPPLAQPSAFRVGAEIGGRYRLTAHMGLAGVGQVFEAIDVQECKDVTVKLIAVNLRSQPDAFAALASVAARSQSLDHPNIAVLHEIAREGDELFVVMERLRGRWLSQLIREVRGQGLEHEIAWPIISGIAHGLAHAHAKGVLHHNLSPHSIFLCEDGSPKIVAFGLLHAAPASNESLDVLDTQTLRAYSEAYTADPWSQSPIVHAADDLYPLGVIAYELLTGRHPFQRCSLVQARQRQLSYEPIPWLDRAARKLLDRCLSFEREVRPRDAQAFVRRLRPGGWRRIFAVG